MTVLAEFCITTLKPQFRGISNLITIDRRASKPLYQQIYDSFRSRIIRGELRAGDLVPSSRELARESRIYRLPVLTAYGQLSVEGYFESRVGAGTFISSSLPSRSTGSLPSAARGQRLLSAQVAALPKYERPSWAESLGPFQVGQPELQKFPIEIWLRLVARYSRRMRLKALQYADAMGLPELREAIATYLRTSRGVRCEAQQVMIVSGSQQPLDQASRVLPEAGTPAWVEEPGYRLCDHLLKAARCRIVPVPVDAEGLNVTAGIKLKRNARAGLVGPSHPYSLGGTIRAARRLQIL